VWPGVGMMVRLEKGEGRGFLGERSMSGRGTGADDCLVQWRAL